MISTFAASMTKCLALFYLRQENLALDKSSATSQSQKSKK